MKCNELDMLIKVNSQYVIHLIARSLDIELPSAKCFQISNNHDK